MAMGEAALNCAKHVGLCCFLPASFPFHICSGTCDQDLTPDTLGALAEPVILPGEAKVSSPCPSQQH